jgi:hypothetical protein
MNTSGIAKHYDTLTPSERLALIVDATARGDETERQRLVHSSPSTLRRVPDYQDLAEGLKDLARDHVCELMELVTLFWKAFVVEDIKADRDKGELTAAERALRSRCLLAYCFTVRFDAFQRVCEELHIDAELMLSHLPGFGTIAGSELVMRAMAFSADEAAAFVKSLDGSTVVTVEAVAARMRGFLESRSAL